MEQRKELAPNAMEEISHGTTPQVMQKQFLNGRGEGEPRDGWISLQIKLFTGTDRPVSIPVTYRLTFTQRHPNFYVLQFGSESQVLHSKHLASVGPGYVERSTFTANTNGLLHFSLYGRCEPYRFTTTLFRGYRPAAPVPTYSYDTTLQINTRPGTPNDDAFDDGEFQISWTVPVIPPA